MTAPIQSDIRPEEDPRSKIEGLYGQPLVDLSPILNPCPIHIIDTEACLGLASVQTFHSGGNLQDLEVTLDDELTTSVRDFGQVIRNFSDQEFKEFVSISDTPDVFDVNKKHEYVFGEDTDLKLNDRQMKFLKYKHGIFFSWQTVYLLAAPEESGWSNLRKTKSHFSADARKYFPHLCKYVETLPFDNISRVAILGIDPLHFGMTHFDRGVDCFPEPNEFVVIAPNDKKRFFVTDSSGENRHYSSSHLYWFNDFDYHGVETDPFFRYSIRIDGKFSEKFKKTLKTTFLS